MSLLLQMVTAAALLSSPTVGSGTAGVQSQPARATYSERYGVLSEKNIFLRDRRRRSFGRDREGPSRTASAPRTLEQSLVLTGVVFEDGEFTAYVEDMERSSVLRLHVGEPAGRGTIAQIQIDAVEYEQGGRRTSIDVGRSFTGEQFRPVTTMPSGSTSQPSAGPLPNPNDPNLTIEERMRLRRMQELNQ